MIRTIIVWSGTGVAAIVSFGISALLIVGVPKPPAITTESVGRVGWTPIFEDLDLYRQSIRSSSISGWMPDGEHLFVSASYRVLDRRLHTLAGPGADPVLLRDVPRNVSGIHSGAGRDHVIFRWDSDGTEQFQLYRWDLGAEEPVRLTNGTERVFFGAFEPDGDRYAFLSNRRNGTDMDLYIADPATPGSERLVLEVEGTWTVHDWSPTVDVLLMSRVLSNVANELYLFDLGSGELTRLTDPLDGPAAHRSVQWAEDGRALYMVSDKGTEFLHLRRLDLTTGSEEVLTDELPWDISSVSELPDGSRLVLVVNEDGRNVVYLYDVRKDALEPLELFTSGLVAGVGLHPSRPRMVVNHTDERGVARGYIYDLSTRKLTLWTGPEPSERVVPAAQLIRYPTFDAVDGEPRLVPAFVYPGVGDGPHPVVIDIHGGPEAQARLRSSQIRLQRKGITVVTPNVRGSTGYGKTYTKLDDWYLREDAVRDIGALLDWVAQNPSLDESRVVVKGGSYGGYMVLASLVHFGDRIRCGVDVVGVSNFVTFLENTADYRRDLRRAEYGDERDPEMRAFLESISPLTDAEQIVAQLMVVQGANDPRVPVTESRQMVDKVRVNQSEVRYIEGANEGHGFRNPWNAIYADAAQRQMMTECLR